MAIIKELKLKAMSAEEEEKAKQTLRRESPTNAKCFFVRGDEGVCLKITTDGSAARQDKGKASQIVTFPPRVVAQLRQILAQMPAD